MKEEGNNAVVRRSSDTVSGVRQLVTHHWWATTARTKLLSMNIEAGEEGGFPPTPSLFMDGGLLI